MRKQKHTARPAGHTGKEVAIMAISIYNIGNLSRDDCKRARAILNAAPYEVSAVLNTPHYMERGDIWTRDHRVVNVRSARPDKCGDMFQWSVDIMTGAIQ